MSFSGVNGFNGAQSVRHQTNLGRTSPSPNGFSPVRTRDTQDGVLLHKPKAQTKDLSVRTEYPKSRFGSAPQKKILFSDADGSIYKETEAYTKYRPRAIHVSTAPVKENETVVEAGEKLLVRRKGFMELDPEEQVIKSNPAVAAKQKLSQADAILAQARERNETEKALRESDKNTSFIGQAGPYALTAACGGALAGLVTKNAVLTIGSLAALGGTLYAMNRFNGQSNGSPQSLRDRLSAMV